MSTTPSTQPDVVTVTITAPVVPPSSLVEAEAKKAKKIRNQATADLAGVFLRRVRQRVREIKASFVPAKKRLKESADEVNKLLAEQLAPYEAADKLVADAVTEWLLAEKTRAEVESKRALLAASEEAKARQASQVEELTAAAAVAPTAEDRRQLRGQATAVARATPLPVLTERVAPAGKIAGISLTQAWEAEVDDVARLVQAVAAGTQPLAALTPNMAYLNEQARRFEKDLNIPGVRAVPKDPSLSARKPT